MKKTDSSFLEWNPFGHKLYLLREKAIWNENKRYLLLADSHFGKAGHFRKAGIPIPESIHQEDFKTLTSLIEKWQPESVFILGDFFHSDFNQDWRQLTNFLDQHQLVDFHLVKGNHDILPKEAYLSSKLIVHESPLEMDNILLSHEPIWSAGTGKLNICGHLHPGIAIKGKGRQRLMLPCYFYRNNCLVMPAFGSFTGLMDQGLDQGEEIYAITPQSVIPIKIKNKVG